MILGQRGDVAMLIHGGACQRSRPVACRRSWPGLAERRRSWDGCEAPRTEGELGQIRSWDGGEAPEMEGELGQRRSC
jgi:hypothetical protein